MKIKKTIEIEETICDVCGIRNDQTFMSNCSICGKDICTEHTYLITSLGSSTSVGRLCPDCLTKRFTPEVNLDTPKQMSGPSIITQIADNAWRKIHRHWLFGGRDEN